MSYIQVAECTSARRDNAMNWKTLQPHQKVDLVKEHWQSGHSAKDIARSIGARLGQSMTRQMIIGVYSRYADDLQKHPLQAAFKSMRPRKQSLRAPTKPRTANRAFGRRNASAKPETKPLHAPESRFIPMLDLGSNECRWPVNNAPVGEAHLFCGCSTDLGKPYCEYHTDMSIGTGTASERRVYRASRLVAEAAE